MNVVDRIRLLCDERGIAISRLEKDLGFSNGYIRSLRRGIMPIERMEKVADYFGTTVDALRFGDDSAPRPTTSHSHWIPVLGRVAAGIPIEMIEDVIDYEEIPDTYGECFALQINGDSMSPDLPRGSVVVVHKQDDVESGEVAIVALNGSDAVCKRVIKDTEGIVLQSFNPDFPPRFVPLGEDVTILGKVIESRRKW